MNGTSPLENAIAVVTGATGFIGSHLVDYLVGHGCIVHALVRETSDRRWLNKSNKVKVHTVDLLQSSPINFLQEADYLFHCAGLTKAKTRDDYFSGNVHSCEILYERCVTIGANLKTIIHLSWVQSWVDLSTISNYNQRITHYQIVDSLNCQLTTMT